MLQKLNFITQNGKCEKNYIHCTKILFLSISNMFRPKSPVIKLYII